jgi:2'-5' RNA ligase
VTLARCQRISPQSVRKFLKANVDLDVGMIRVDSFHLYSSKLTPAGPIHTRELSVHCRQ